MEALTSQITTKEATYNLIVRPTSAAQLSCSDMGAFPSDDNSSGLLWTM